VIKKLMRNYGMVLVLLGLCLLFSILTLKEQSPDSVNAANQMIEQIDQSFNKNDVIVTVGAFNKDSEPFAELLNEKLLQKNYNNVHLVTGIPRDLRLLFEQFKKDNTQPAAILTTGDVVNWRLISLMSEFYPEFKGCSLLVPETYFWPDFLKQSNLVAIVDRIVVIAVIALGMTMVIITGGIDLSVGSLIAVSAVISTIIMKMMGGLQGSAWAVLVGFLTGIFACGFIGGFGGYLVARFKVPPFITTLAIMLMGRGLAFMITGGFSIYQVPKSLSWLGQGALLEIPNTVILLILLYFLAHVFMSHTRTGRYIYAVGGNEEAARLSGVPVKYIIIFVYIISGITAGIGGSIQASQLNTGTPNMGLMYELYVIAAVVVGGTSLSGGTGKILGTLIGVFVISVIQNGMNLLGMESYSQQVVLGLVILAAVLLDKVRSGKFLSNLTGKVNKNE
jgi:ribose transport system permease protein